MPVRLRITFLFALVVLIILGIVCASIYFFSYRARIEIIKTRLTNRGLTTARFLSRSEIFDRRILEQIDSLTTISLKRKSVQAYDQHNRKIYGYADIANDTIGITNELLDETRAKGHLYFVEGGREVVSYYYTEQGSGIVVVCAADDAEAKKNLASLKNILLLSFIGGIGIVIVGGYFFSKGLLQPIRKITKEVTEISAQNLARRIDTGIVKDEWYYMADTLNDLLDRLEESFELQRRFIANASHELSTPLTAISSQLEIALQRERSLPQYEKVLSSVLQDVREMSKLTQTLLELAKTAGNKGGLDISLVRIDEILMELPATLQKQNSNYQVFLRFEELPENEDDLLVFGNAELLFTAIKNIAINACKYSPDHRAEISLHIDTDHFLIAVADKGVGIPESDITHIFQPFYRTDNSRFTEGFGLGLPLAQRIVKLHRGEITVESNQGKGTVFTIRIPSARRGNY